MHLSLWEGSIVGGDKGSGVRIMDMLGDLMPLERRVWEFFLL